MVSAAVCLRPIASSTRSLKVWGLMEMRVTPAFFRARSLPSSTVSGLPASTVNSRTAERSKDDRTASVSAVRSSADRLVGVPPPK